MLRRALLAGLLTCFSAVAESQKPAPPDRRIDRMACAAMRDGQHRLDTQDHPALLEATVTCRNGRLDGEARYRLRTPEVWGDQAKRGAALKGFRGDMRFGEVSFGFGGYDLAHGVRGPAEFVERIDYEFEAGEARRLKAATRTLDLEIDLRADAPRLIAVDRETHQLVSSRRYGRTAEGYRGLHGPDEEFGRSGVLRRRTYYCSGFPVGFEQHYSEQGVLERVVDYSKSDYAFADEKGLMRPASPIQFRRTPESVGHEPVLAGVRLFAVEYTIGGGVATPVGLRVRALLSDTFSEFFAGSRVQDWTHEAQGQPPPRIKGFELIVHSWDYIPFDLLYQLSKRGESTVRSSEKNLAALLACPWIDQAMALGYQEKLVALTPVPERYVDPIVADNAAAESCFGKPTPDCLTRRAEHELVSSVARADYVAAGHLRLAGIHAATGRYTDAKRQISLADVRLDALRGNAPPDPGRAADRVLLSRINRLSGDAPTADRILDEAQRLILGSPGARETPSLKPLIHVAMEQARLGRTDAVLENVRRGAQFGMFWPLAELATWHARKGDIARALQLRATITDFPSNAVFYEPADIWSKEIRTRRLAAHAKTRPELLALAGATDTRATASPSSTLKDGEDVVASLHRRDEEHSQRIRRIYRTAPRQTSPYRELARHVAEIRNGNAAAAQAALASVFLSLRGHFFRELEASAFLDLAGYAERAGLKQSALTLYREAGRAALVILHHDGGFAPVDKWAAITVLNDVAQALAKMGLVQEAAQWLDILAAAPTDRRVALHDARVRELLRELDIEIHKSCAQRRSSACSAAQPLDAFSEIELVVGRLEDSAREKGARADVGRLTVLMKTPLLFERALAEAVWPADLAARGRLLPRAIVVLKRRGTTEDLASIVERVSQAIEALPPSLAGSVVRANAALARCTLGMPADFERVLETASVLDDLNARRVIAMGEIESVAGQCREQQASEAAQADAVKHLRSWVRRGDVAAQVLLDYVEGRYIGSFKMTDPLP